MPRAAGVGVATPRIIYSRADPMTNGIRRIVSWSMA
jgi:hypothetical protein